MPVIIISVVKNLDFILIVGFMSMKFEYTQKHIIKTNTFARIFFIKQDFLSECFWLSARANAQTWGNQRKFQCKSRVVPYITVVVVGFWGEGG